MNILKVLSSIVTAKVPSVIPQYTDSGMTAAITHKPWFLSRGMVSGVGLIALGVYSVFTGGSIDFTDVHSLVEHIDSILIILGGAGAAIGRAQVVK